MSDQPILRVRNLSVTIETTGGFLHAVRGVDLTVARGETVAIIGESGAGKSATIRAILGLLRRPRIAVHADEITFQGTDLLAMPEDQFRRLRGSQLALISQNALSALDPCFSVGYQIAEVLRGAGVQSRAEIRGRTIELLERVGMPDPAHVVRRYPHELSGGMRQRVDIALAVALGPAVLFADEPTTSLDVTIQAQVLRLLQSLSGELGMSLVLVTHDMGVVASIASRVMVMYAGRVVDEADVASTFDAPTHPYTIGLLASTPGYAADIVPIPGRRPSPFDMPGGCPFHPRCPRAADICRTTEPALERLTDNRSSACFFPAIGTRA